MLSFEDWQRLEDSECLNSHVMQVYMDMLVRDANRLVRTNMARSPIAYFSGAAYNTLVSAKVAKSDVYPVAGALNYHRYLASTVSHHGVT